MRFRRHGQSLVVHAPAKLNLFLEILDKRPDGYHELETLMVTVGLYDTLFFTEEDSRNVRLTCRDAGRRHHESNSSEFPVGNDNLVVQAAELIRRHVGIERGVRIELSKRIPVAAGLAGGSSDAAATLAGLNRFWQLNLSAGELGQLASQLGSDVAFFLNSTGSAICRGRGERVEPLSMPLGMHFVIARPNSGLSTADVYRRCRPVANPQSVDRLAEYLTDGRWVRASRMLHNALRQPAEELNPHLRQLRDRFRRQPVLGHEMSGSGTAYFGICTTRRQALAVAARLQAGWDGRVYAVRSCC